MYGVRNFQLRESRSLATQAVTFARHSFCFCARSGKGNRHSKHVLNNKTCGGMNVYFSEVSITKKLVDLITCDALEFNRFEWQ
ncbi:hypothetical protein ETAA8_33880 [Anatilimnocola aggregata]|uniref:Uncharacterized protein n=1 Tax=Anatilimnocola aggregata TaxID=2528021 RepID=A0A517YDH7_9BACT|nr:hypothetical protein ETAA8_33880 [Anatilimnocola aggregata]